MGYYLYEIIYVCQGTKQWTCVQANTPTAAVAKLEKDKGGNIVEILNLEKTFVADCAALIS